MVVVALAAPPSTKLVQLRTHLFRRSHIALIVVRRNRLKFNKSKLHAETLAAEMSQQELEAQHWLSSQLARMLGFEDPNAAQDMTDYVYVD